MDAGDLLGRGISFPPRVGPDGRIAWSEGEANVREAIQVILSTERAERVMLPEFGGGLGAFLFEPNTVATRHRIEQAIASGLSDWEPRIQVDGVTVEEDPADPGAAVATISYRLVATKATARLRLALTLAT
ncbi:MAG TPA: GPW/gp25 family protein [Anaeromyxobacter sp.]|nr:GPW/gp25 family protein [Anaeromyxobacter sp.]